MKKVKFRNAGRAAYAVLCAGLLVVGVASVAGYRAAVSSVTEGLITPKDEADVDYSEVDAVLENIKKAQENSAPVPQENPSSADADAAEPPFTGLPAGNQQPGQIIDQPTDQQLYQQQATLGEAPADDALSDVTNELEALYYEQAVMMPVNGDITVPYSEGELVRSSGGVWRTHDGVDIAAEEGTKVRAMTSGTVTEVYDDPVWGCCVLIDHGNTMTGCYYGLSEDIPVTVGDRLNAGDEVGSVGNTADIEADAGPHLHFALKYENRWIDPVSYIEPMK